MKYKCSTRFDITATGVTGHFKQSRVPFTDRAGNKITNADSWNRSRNQQRNWETLTQLISLRTQILDLTDPENQADLWTFEFATESDVFHDGIDPVGVLRLDSGGVPMVRDLDNAPDIDSTLVTSGAKQNVWFVPITINI